MKEQTTLHGVFLDIYGSGVLITGRSGIGKSELALGLIERGHHLIADDYIVFEKEAELIIGTCPPASQGFLAIRDLGIINLTKLLGQQVISAPKPLELVIELVSEGERQAVPFEACLQGTVTMQNVMNKNVPKQSLVIKPHRPMAILVETCVRLQQGRQAGYDAPTDFIARQTSLIDNPT